MFLDFIAAIAALGTGAAVRIANAARPAGDYLFNTLLPEQNRPSYSVQSGNMTIRATMAGLVAMDSPYPPGGLVESSEFHEQTAKIANEVSLSEQALRTLQDFMLRMGLGGTGTTEALAKEALNFLDKVILQPHMDTAEWLRGQALVFGAIDWTFNRKRLQVDYLFPAGNFLTPRTGNDGYGGSTSKFWVDVRLLRKALKGNVRAIIAHPDTIDMIRYNPVNSLVTVAEGDGSITFRRTVNNGASFSPDQGDTVTFVSYNKEGEMLNPADPENPVVMPFMERGKLLGVGNNASSGYQVGQGSVVDAPDDSNILGYTHIAPTTEGGGRPGRWADIYTPQNMPYALNGRAVSNILPVIEAPSKVAVATTDMV